MLTRLEKSEINNNVVVKALTTGTGIWIGGMDDLTVNNNEVYGGDVGIHFISSATRSAAVGNNTHGLPANFGTNIVRGTQFGQSSIAAGVTSGIVTHGFGATPSLSQISITPTSNYGSAGVTSWWISNPTSTTFTVNINSGSTGTFSFAWSVTATSNN